MGAQNRAYLRNLARLYADGRPAGANAFVVDSDASANAVSLDTLINGQIAQFYDLLVQARGADYYVTDAALAVVAGTALYSLPADFYQLLTLSLTWAANDVELMHPTSQRERITYGNWNTWGRYAPKAYRLRGTQAAPRTVEIFPTPTSAVAANVRYIPVYAPLTDDTTTVDFCDGWEKLVCLGAAIEYRAIAEKDAGALTRLYAEQLARIEGLANQRDATYAEQVQDVFPEQSVDEYRGDRRWI